MIVQDVLAAMENTVTLWAGARGLSRAVLGVSLTIDAHLTPDAMRIMVCITNSISAIEFDGLIRRVAHAGGAGIMIPQTKLPLACKITADTLEVPVLMDQSVDFNRTVERLLVLLLHSQAYHQRQSLDMLVKIQEQADSQPAIENWVAWASDLLAPCEWHPAAAGSLHPRHPGSVIVAGLEVGEWIDPQNYWDTSVLRMLALATTLIAERNIASWSEEWNRDRAFLLDLLEGVGGRGRGVSAVQRLAWNFELPTVVLVLRLDERIQNSLAYWKKLRQQIADIDSLIRRQGYTSRLFPYGEYLAVLLQGAPGTLTPAHLTSLGRQLVTLEGIAVGIGRPDTGMSGIRKSLNEAEEALVIGHSEQQKVSYFSQLGIRRYLYGWYDSPRSSQLADELLAPLETDNGINAMLTETLGAFLRNGTRLTATAQSLKIHRNTLRYRLDRLGEILGLDFNDPDTLLILQLAWRSREQRQRREHFAQETAKFIQHFADDDASDDPLQ